MQELDKIYLLILIQYVKYNMNYLTKKEEEFDFYNPLSSKNNNNLLNINLNNSANFENDDN